MRIVNYLDGEERRFLELEDMPPCRACGCAPVEKKTGIDVTRLQCPECGIRTAGSTNSQAKFITWKRVMG